MPESLKHYRKYLVALATALTVILSVGLPLPDKVTTILVAALSLLGAWGVGQVPNKPMYPDVFLVQPTSNKPSLPPPPPQE